MTDNLFDKFIKDKIGNHSSPVPDGLWEKIQQGKDKKRPGILWWKNYGYIILITITAASAIAILSNSKNTSNTKSIAAVTKPPIQSSTNPLKSLTQNTNGITSENNAAVGSNNRANVITKGSNKNNKSEDVSAGSTNLKTGVNNTPNNISLVSLNSSNHTYLNTRSIGKRTTGSSNLNNPRILASTTNEDVFASALNKTLLTTAQYNKNLTDYNLNDKLLKNVNDFHFGLVDCPSARGPVKNDFYVEVFASPDYAMKSIKNTGAASSDFLRRKDSTESSRISFTAGFLLAKTMGENFLIKAGLQYTQINEKFNYRNENERKLTTVITIRTVVRTPGDTVFVRDTSTLEQVGYRVKTTYNRYKSIDVPLMISYEWGNENLKEAVTGGVILNLYSWQKGESLDTTYVPVAFNKTTGQTFKQNIGVGFYAGFSLIKKVTEKSSFFMEPYFRYNVSNMTNNNSFINQKFNVAGVKLGVRYKLNGSRQR